MTLRDLCHTTLLAGLTTCAVLTWQEVRLLRATVTAEAHHTLALLAHQSMQTTYQHLLVRVLTEDRRGYPLQERQPVSAPGQGED